MPRPKWIQGKKQRGGRFSLRGKLIKIPSSITAKKPGGMSRTKFFSLLKMPKSLKIKLRDLYLQDSALRAGRNRDLRTRAKKPEVLIKVANRLWKERIMKTMPRITEAKSLEQIAKEINAEGVEVSAVFISKVNSVLGIFSAEEMEARRIRVSQSRRKKGMVTRVNGRTAEIIAVHKGDIKKTAEDSGFSQRTIYRVLKKNNKTRKQNRTLTGV